MRRPAGLIPALLLGAAAMASGAADAYTLSVDPAPGAVFAYDGTYRLSVPSAKNNPGLTLVSVEYGLVFKVETVDAEGAVMRGEYDRFESKTHRGSGASSLGGLVYGQGFRFRLNKRGQSSALPAGGYAPGLDMLKSIWPGWPDGAIAPGSAWRDESSLPLAGGGLAKSEREYRMDGVRLEEDGRVILPLAFVERGTIASRVGLAGGGSGSLNGTILGVGQILVDEASGMIERSASASVFQGTLTSEGGPPVDVRLEIEAAVFLRR